MLAGIAVLAVVGIWAYAGVRESLRELRAAGLASLAEAEARGLQLWIDEKKRDAQRWASSPRVQRAAAALAQAAERGAACAAAPEAELRDEIAPYAAVEEVALFHLIGRDGRIIAALEGRNCGITVSERFRQRLAPVFEGETVFLRPWREQDRFATPPPRGDAEPMTWIETPVRGADGSVTASLGFGRVATQRFTELMRLTAASTTRDAYAFDEEGNLLTRTRHARALGPLPRTPLVEAALARTQGTEGLLLEPYRNDRGAEVIGAYRWIPDSGMVLAVEIEAREAYGPLGFVPVAFGVLLGLLLLAMGIAASTSMWAVRAQLREAQRVGLYRLEREIGEGGMSRIYFARHELLQRPAAVKVLKPHLATDEVVTRFRREAQLCSQLSHPNTIEIYDYGATRDGRWYYAMEYLRGVSIQQIVDKEGPMAPARVVHALRLACGSLEEAHGRGWVHRDVKPSNLMLCVQGGEHDVVKLVDFGLVKQARDAQTRDITQYSKILGTPLYMAPERLRDPADADARADIYALAAVAWFALAGKPAFDEQTDHAIVYRVMNEAAPELPAAVPARARELLGPLIARCLAKDREARPASIAEVREVLERFAAQAPWSEAEARAWWESHGELLA